MHRFPLFLCIAALAGAVVPALLFIRVDNAKRLLEIQFVGTSERATKLETYLAVANDQNGILKSDLTAAAAELTATKEKLSTAETRAAGFERDLTKAKSAVAIYEEMARARADEIAALKAELSDTRATFVSPEAVAAYKTTIAELERQLANASHGAIAPTAAGASTAVFASRVGRATIVTVGPSNAFVVLNFGSARGAQLGQRLNVSQGTENVATVLISDVRANFSVAQVQPDTLRGVLHKGDLALLIR